MIPRKWLSFFTAFITMGLGVVTAQPPRTLTLKEAEAIAVKNHPQVSAALLAALAANQVVLETRSAYFPLVAASVTGVGALDNSRIAAGSLNNPVIYNRAAAGVAVSQLITDFGRTKNLTETSRYRARAQQQNAQATRAQVLLQADRTYFVALRAQSVLTVAKQTVAARQLVADQVSALAKSKLRSGLDVSFANVNLSEAKLLLVSAQNDVNASYAELSQALGYPTRENFVLTDEPMPGAPPADVNPLIGTAMQDRPEIASLRAQETAALKFEQAERDLYMPTVSAVMAVGAIPAHEDTLHSRYGALGFNINIPVFNGGLFSARRQEAALQAQAATQNVRNIQNQISRDVQVAWLNANTAYQRLALTAELLDQANLALDLAQTRYHLGLSSIVELSQAQLNKTSSEIAASSARYDYQVQRSVLDYQIGALR